MKATELRDLSVEELQGKVRDFQQELFSLKYQLATGQIENPMRIRLVRRDIARARTILKEKGLEAG
ncbi:MAG: 50S ribosomal protein L29 [Candidatus Tectomicrobia bacterium]|uniref:Large ribosomal subunit protein uL29 n=1 Tax=Tectimicrobiota bacterium TaxID=2528274 RepID=A0A932CPK3_UNCTE|nr:50S ribosomal protein L29 [Candidatus Tectomicrobia bacterium]